MSIRKSQLRQIIREEVKRVVQEASPEDAGMWIYVPVIASKHPTFGTGKYDWTTDMQKAQNEINRALKGWLMADPHLAPGGKSYYDQLKRKHVKSEKSDGIWAYKHNRFVSNIKPGDVQGAKKVVDKVNSILKKYKFPPLAQVKDMQ